MIVLAPPVKFITEVDDEFKGHMTMASCNRTCYPYVWFAHDGWWFKAFDECFGPYEHPEEARHNLQLLQHLSRQLQEALHPRRRLS